MHIGESSTDSKIDQNKDTYEQCDNPKAGESPLGNSYLQSQYLIQKKLAMISPRSGLQVVKEDLEEDISVSISPGTQKEVSPALTIPSSKVTHTRGTRIRW